MPPQTFLIIFLLLTAHIHHTLLSISTTLLHRVSNLRLSRADVPGALRAKKLAVTVEYFMGFRFWPTVLYLCWEFYRKVALVEKGGGGYGELLTRSMTELTRVRNNKELSAWVDKYNEDFRRLFKSLISHFHSVFTKSGPLKELMEVLKEEMEEGDFVKDCVEVGSNDLRGLSEILKELSSSYTTTYDDDMLKKEL